MSNLYAKVAEVELSYRPLRCARPQVTDGRAAATLFRSNWDEGQIEFRESVKIMLLNLRGNCMGICTVGEGGGAECSVDVRHVLQTALLGNAKYIVMCHNHPSGKVEPSRMDDDLTKRVHCGCEAIGIKLLDHVIIAPEEDEYYSYSDNGKL